MEIKVTLPVEVSDDEMTALMTLGLKSVHSWCSNVEVVKAKRNCPLEEVITHNGVLRFWDFVGCQKLELTRSDLLTGIGKVISEYNDFSMLQELNSFSANNMLPQTADLIIQLALFGSLTYLYEDKGVNIPSEKKVLNESAAKDKPTKKSK